MAILAKIFLKKKIQIIFHDHFGSGIIKDRKALRFLSHHIDKVICVNDELFKWSINNLQINKNRIFIINNFSNIRKNQFFYKNKQTTSICS